MSQWIVRLVFILVVAGVMGSALWNNIATNRLIEQATGTNPKQQIPALRQMAQRDDFYDLIQSRKPPARLRVAIAIEQWNEPDAVKVALAMLRDPEPKVRDRFLQSLRVIGGNHLPALAEGLKHSDSKVKNGTVQVMTYLGLKCLPVALKAFEDSSARASAMEVLVQFGSHSVPGLLNILRTTQDEGLQLDTITALGRIGDRRATEAILPFLKLPVEKRRIVLTALGGIADPRTESILISALHSEEEDPDARAQCALGLGQIGSYSALQALLKGLSDPNLTVADACAVGLRRAGVRAISTIAQALRHPSLAVRLRAVSALSTLNDGGAVALLTQAMKDPAIEVRRASAHALGTTEHPSAVGVLIQALGDAEGGVAQNATQSLVRIGKPAIPSLIGALQSPNETVAYFSARALAEIPEAEPELLKSARNPTTRRYALLALKERNALSAKPLFEEALNSEDPFLRELAQTALKQLNP